jgi:excisionase family DNA binding protein
MSIVKVLRERTEPLNVGEVAQLLDVTEKTVQKWARQGQIPSIRIGDTIRFDPTVMAEFINVQAAEARMSARFLHRAPGNPAEYQMLRTDLGELAPKEIRKPKDGQAQTQKAPQKSVVGS